MTAQVASVHFAPVLADRSIYGGLYGFSEVPLGADPVIITLEDKVQRDEGPVSSGPGGGRRQPLRYHVDGYEIASDIVREWTETGLGMTPAAHPGIWTIRERLPELDEKGAALVDGFGKQRFRPATASEKAAMWTEDLRNARQADREYAHWCWMEGNRMAANAALVPYIPKNYKRAAKQFGLPAEWLKEGFELQVIPCPSCTTVIFKTAIVCPKCNEPVDMERWSAWQARKDAAVRDARDAMKRQTA